MGTDRAAVVETEPPQLPMMFRADTILHEQFDTIGWGTLPEGWDTVDVTAEPADAYWHIDDFMVNYGDSCWWCGVETMAGWESPPGYGDLWRQFLILSLDLSSASSPCSLIFDHQYAMEDEAPEAPFDAWDGCNVRVSTNGTDWEVIEPVGGYPKQALYCFFLQDGDTLPAYSGVNLTWEEARFDLSSYVGDSLYVRFWVASDMYCSDQGNGCDYDGAWYIDNLLVGVEGDTVFFTDCESGGEPELVAEGYPAFETGNFWFVVDSLHHPQPDGNPVYYSDPQSAYCGDTASMYGNGTYAPAQHGQHGLSNALVTPTLDLSAYNTVLLTFMQRGYGDGSGGYGYIDMSTDGGENWTELEMQNFQPGGGAWEFHFWDLSPAAGESDVKVRFRCGSGTAAYHYVYWYVDDIVITGSGSQCWAQVDDDNPVWYWGDFEQYEVGAIKLENCQPGAGLIDQARVLFYSPSVTNSGDFAIHTYEHNTMSMLPGDELMDPETLTVNVAYYQEWVTIDLRDKDVRIDSGDVFWLGVEKLGTDDCTVLMDTLAESGVGNAIYFGGVWQFSVLSGDFMFRALIDTTTMDVAEGNAPAKVGGLVLSQNSPNPVRSGATSIQFGLPSRSNVSLKLYDAAGRLVRTLFDGERDAGTFSVDWNGLDDRGHEVANGVYFYMLSTDEASAVRKLSLVR
jgi:hypothetical protein